MVVVLLPLGPLTRRVKSHAIGMCSVTPSIGSMPRAETAGKEKMERPRLNCGQVYTLIHRVYLEDRVWDT